ncbi:MAG TPA: ATPase, T2SS/T4P/T4SS family [Armatimonadota bacterium]|jgi:type IV pilus assembly protein PilB
MAGNKKDLGDIMVEQGWISAAELEEARKALMSTSGTDLGKVVTDLGFASEQRVTQARAIQLGMKSIDLSAHPPKAEAILAVSQNLCQRHNVIPVMKNGNAILLAVSDPSNILAVDDVRLATGCRIETVLAAPSDIEAAMIHHYGSGEPAVVSDSPGNGTAHAMKESSGPSLASIVTDVETYKSRENLQDDDVQAAVTDAEQAPIIRVANAVIQQAIKDGASDIHVEPDRRGVRCRYRVDGVLHEAMTLPRYIHPPLISRYKIMSDMNIAERRVPQDGRIPISYEGKEYDLRVSCLPTLHGEKIVMRILDKSSVLIGLGKLGFFPETQAQIESIITQPNGMILTTGPTGSGKTTTQYSVLHKINNVEVNILTIEDPVEYQLPGISQVHVNRKAGLTFASALRSFLRQDPDIIMVGEIRDLETAEIGIEAALTGHLVLSTLHTNDAPSAVTRLVDMGVEPYLISAVVIGILAQRLCRKVCLNCRYTYEVPAHDLRRFGYKPESDDQMVQLVKGRGCEICKQTGYKGRLGIHELMLINDEIQELIVRRAPLADVREAARANGMSLLREDGLKKVLEGVTTPEEVMRVVFTAGSNF